MKKLLDCVNVTFLGLWKDPDGFFGTIPLFELTDPAPEEWNALGHSVAREGQEVAEG